VTVGNDPGPLKTLENFSRIVQSVAEAGMAKLAAALPKPHHWNEEYVLRDAMDGERGSEKIAQALLDMQMDPRNNHHYEVREDEHRESEQRGDVVTWTTVYPTISYPDAGLSPTVKDELRTKLEDPRSWNDAGQGAFVVGDNDRYRVEMSVMPVATVAQMVGQTAYGDTREATLSKERSTDGARLGVKVSHGPLEIEGTMQAADSWKRSSTDAGGGHITHTYENRVAEVQRVHLLAEITDTKTGVRTKVLLDEPPVEVVHNVNRQAQGGK
jgi:hypothetical protein